ncbi:MAG: prolipoprotein diacylglyceryl transferase [Chloroflexota bacterium]|nr:MAG: prolipoprotein diacylglyceryl transferase [Chloroflexota bacterium]
MLPTIDIGPLVLPTAGLVFIVGAWIVLSVTERAAKRLKLNVEATYTLVAIMMGAAFVGARLVFVVLHWPAYQDDLLSIFWPLTTGFNWGAGVAAALFAGLFYTRAKQLPPAATLDALAPGLILALIVLSLSDFAAGPGYGQESSLPWAIDVFGIHRHPVQLYEIAVGVLALVIWWRFVDRRRYEGQLFLLTVAIYAGGRLLFDAFRANTPLTADGFHLVQIASLIILLVCVFLMGRQAVQEESLAGDSGA